VLAASAGGDILLYTHPPPGELVALERAMSSGQISAADAAASYRRIVALEAEARSRLTATARGCGLYNSRANSAPRGTSAFRAGRAAIHRALTHF
jgi:hypothetical protein